MCTLHISNHYIRIACFQPPDEAAIFVSFLHENSIEFHKTPMGSKSQSSGTQKWPPSGENRE